MASEAPPASATPEFVEIWNKNSGARITTTLLHLLEDTGGSLGLATLCVGVGQGLSVVIERA